MTSIQVHNAARRLHKASIVPSTSNSIPVKPSSHARFIKKNPQKYYGCQSSIPNSITDVKQHLLARHPCSNYCSCCGEVFVNEARHPAHARGRSVAVVQWKWEEPRANELFDASLDFPIGESGQQRETLPVCRLIDRFKLVGIVGFAGPSDHSGETK